MGRIAYMISVYKDAEHLLRLVDALDYRADFYIHVDSKVARRPFEKILQGRAVFVKSHWIAWGGFSQVEFQKELLAAVIKSGKDYSRVVCLSGQDYPLWSKEKIVRFFEEHPDKEYIAGINISTIENKRQRNKIELYHFFRDIPIKNVWIRSKFIVASRLLLRFLQIRRKPYTYLEGKQVEIYTGSDYWAITYSCAKYVYEKLCNEKELVRFFRHSFVPSEMCIQTIVFNSPFAEHALWHEGEYVGLTGLTPLHYIRYIGTVQIMTEKDFTVLIESGKMFCRKVVSGQSDVLVERLKEYNFQKGNSL